MVKEATMKISARKLMMCMVVAVLLVGAVSCFATSWNAGSTAHFANSREFPWTAMLKALMTELTGPLPKILGVLGIAAAAIALFAGNGGAGTQKFIMLIFAVSICLFAPSFIMWLSESSDAASGATIYEAIDTARIVVGG